MNQKRVIQTFLIMFFITVPALPQNLDDFVAKYGETNGKGYLQPVADVFGASFNSGLFHSAKMKRLGFQAYLGVSTTAAFIPAKRRTFTATTEGNFAPVQTATVPTILGSIEPVRVKGNAGTVYAFPGGINASLLPFGVPQLTLGSLFGTDATFRFYAQSINEDVGDLSLFSWGIRHSISQYFPSWPVDVAVGYYNQQFTVGEYFNNKAWIANIQASHRFGILTLYGALGYENSNTKIHYSDTEDDTEVNYDLNGSNNVRLTTGVTLNLGPVKLNVDYNFASQSVLCVGLGFAIGEKREKTDSPETTENK